MTKVLDNINVHNNELNNTINESLSRQLQKGVLNQYENTEYNLYKLGCTGSKTETKRYTY